MKQTEIEKLSAEDIIDKLEEFKKKLNDFKNDSFNFTSRKSYTD